MSLIEKILNSNVISNKIYKFLDQIDIKKLKGFYISLLCDLDNINIPRIVEKLKNGEKISEDNYSLLIQNNLNAKDCNPFQINDPSFLDNFTNDDISIQKIIKESKIIKNKIISGETTIDILEKTIIDHITNGNKTIDSSDYVMNINIHGKNKNKNKESRGSDVMNRLDEILINPPDEDNGTEEKEIQYKTSDQLIEKLKIDINHNNSESDSTFYSDCSVVTYRVVVSLYFNGQNISCLGEAITPLLLENFDAIYINLCQKYVNQVPIYLREKCVINICPNDNAINKIYPVLIKEHDPNTIIINIDPCVIVPKNIKKEVKKCLKRFPNSALSICALRFKSVNFFEISRTHGNVSNIFDSSYLIVYKRSFFKTDFRSYLGIVYKYNYCLLADDLIISNYLAKYKIPIRCLFKKKIKYYLI